MKYYPLGSLDSWVEKNEADIKENEKIKMDVSSDVSRGVVVLHERQVAHCDLKPQNILVEQGEHRVHFLLTDFGISKILTDEYLASEAFQIRNVRGLTVAYAAPDVMERFRKKQTGTPIEEKAGDVYSFAVFLYYVLALKSPWN
jgi:serine/threonine protein kinase